MKVGDVANGQTIMNMLATHFVDEPIPFDGTCKTGIIYRRCMEL